MSVSDRGSERGSVVQRGMWVVGVVVQHRIRESFESFASGVGVESLASAAGAKF